VWACDTRLSQAAAGVAASYDVLVNLFERIQFFLPRLEIYTRIERTQLTTELTGVLGKIVAEIIHILAIATKDVKRGLFSE
jgi:hypothetical protein